MQTRLLFAVIFVIFLIPFTIKAKCSAPYICTAGIFCDPANTATIDTLKCKLEAGTIHFSPSATFSPVKTYWIYIHPGDTKHAGQLILTFRKRISLIEVYPWPYTCGVSCYGGIMVNGYLKALPGSAVVLRPNPHGYLVKLQNRLYSNASTTDMSILPDHQFYNEQGTRNLVQGILQGFLWFMIFFNLLLYVKLRENVYLSYAFYILFNSLFLLYSFDYTEAYLFPYHYRLNLGFLSFQVLGLFFYMLFLRSLFMRYCTTYNTVIDRRILLPFCYFTLITNLLLSSTLFYRIDIYEKMFGLVNVIDTGVAITVFVYLRKGMNQLLRIIVVGSLAMIAGGCLSLTNIQKQVPVMLFYETGLFVELLLFTYVLGRQYTQLLEDRYEALLKQNQLQHELDGKNRELVYMAMRLSAHDESIASMKTKIEEYKTIHPGLSKNIKSIEAEISLNNDESLWNEFELHFNKTHPAFYKALAEQYPALTSNEVKLCAFLKLNLNTKDIARISHKSPRSIEVMRSRIRQKMELSRDTNLNQILMQL